VRRASTFTSSDSCISTLTSTLAFPTYLVTTTLRMAASGLPSSVFGPRMKYTPTTSTPESPPTYILFANSMLGSRSLWLGEPLRSHPFLFVSW